MSSSTSISFGSSQININIPILLALFIVWVIICFVLYAAFYTIHEWMARRRAGLVRKGLNKKSLESLPELSFAAEHDQKFSLCAICLTEYVAGDKIRVLPPCEHGFHVECVDTWLVSHSSCPSCRRQVIVPAGSQGHKELPIYYN